MRRLMYIAIGFAAACIACAYTDGGYEKYLIAGIVVFLLCLMDWKVPFLRKLTVSALGCVLGFLWFSHFYGNYFQPVIPWDKQHISLDIRASDYGQQENYAVWFDGTTEIGQQTYRIKTRLNGNLQIEPGVVLSGEFFLKVVKSGYGSGKDIFLTAYQQKPVSVSRDENSRWDDVAKIRRVIKEKLKESFPEDTYPFAKALFLGDASDISYGVDTDLKVSGIRHVVAVSGLHISIVFGLLSILTFRKRFLTALVGFPLLFFFAALTGLTPSVTRSCLMWALVLLGRLVDREYDGPTALGFAVLVMLLINPMVITAVGFQLSAASVAGIFLFSPGVLQWMRGFFGEIRRKTLRGWLIRTITASVSVTLGALVLTTPLCAYYFGMVSLVGVITNLLALWVISGIFYGIMAVCLLHLIIPGGAAFLASVIAWPIRYVLWIAQIMADFPLAAVYTVSPYITAWLILVYVLLAVFLISGNRRADHFCCCTVIGLCLALAGAWTECGKDDVRITVLNVGQGQSILLQSEGRSYLVDCGGDHAGNAADLAAETLLSQGTAKLDGLILTHMDKDHVKGAPGLMERLETDLLVLPEERSDLADFTDGRVLCAARTLEISFGESRIRIFPADFPGNSNEKSLCVLFETEKCDILITGDRDEFGERSLLRNADIPDVDILIAGHHGSAESTCEELLQAVKPEIVCISVGAENFYGHPAPQLLQRLSAFGCDVYRTDVQGTITIRR